MATLITLSDFVGKYAIPTDALSTPMLSDIMDSTETEILNNLLGIDLANLFLADSVSGAPVTPIYLDLYNPIQLADRCYYENYSSGIKEMLKCFVYFNFYANRNISATNLGLKKVDSSNSSATGTKSVLANKYNLGVANYKVIQQYILQNIDLYQDFQGIDKPYNSLF